MILYLCRHLSHTRYCTVGATCLGLNHLYSTWYYSTTQCRRPAQAPCTLDKHGKQARKEQRGGWGVGAQARRVKGKPQNKKAAAACVNWLMLPPLRQINSTGQEEKQGGEKVQVGAGLGAFIKGLSFACHLLSLCERASERQLQSGQSILWLHVKKKT